MAYRHMRDSQFSGVEHLSRGHLGGWDRVNNAWVTAIVAALFGLGAGRFGLRVWRGQTINRRNRIENENKLAILSVTMIPTSVFFLAISLGNACLQMRHAVANQAVKDVFLVLATLMGVAALLAMGFALSLFFFQKPMSMVAPHLRKQFGD